MVRPLRRDGGRHGGADRPAVRRDLHQRRAILAFKGLPERALEALVILLGALVASALCLTPVATETLDRRGRSPATMAGQLLLSAVGTLLFLIGAIGLAAGAGGGLYWVLGGIVGAVVGAVLNAWVLLIEILR